MGPITPDSKIRRCDGLIATEVDGELIGLHLEHDHCYGFNATATRIWALLEQPRTLSELANMLAGEYHVDRERCLADIRALLEELRAERLISVESG